MGLAARVDGEGVECEEVDCACRADLLLSGGSVAVGAWLIDWRLSKNRFRSGLSLITVASSLPLELCFFFFLSPLSEVFFSLEGILPAKFTGPDWPVRDSSFG